MKPKGKWPLMVAIPGETLSTEEARRVLPAKYSRADAVANVQNSMLLLAAFIEARHDLLAAALNDRLHQPYRAALCPLLPSLTKLVGSRGILGVALSGAGPSVLIFLDPKVSPSKVRQAILSHLRTHHLSAELLESAITHQGARDARDWNRKR